MAQKLPIQDAPSVVADPSRPREYAPLNTGTAEAYGYGVGREIGNAATGFARLQLAADMEPVNRQRELYAAARASMIDDPNDGALAKKEMNAQGIAKLGMQWFDQQMEELRKPLNDRQRRLFDRYMLTERFSLAHALSGHELREMTKAGEQGFKSSLNLIKNSAAGAVQSGVPDDAPGGLNSQLADGLNQIETRAPIVGWDQAQLDLQKLGFVTDFHARVIDSYGQDYAKAKEYLAKHRVEMAQDVAGDYDRKLTGGHRAQETGLESERVWAAMVGPATDEATGRFDENAAWKVFDTQSPEVKGMVRERVTAMVHERLRRQNREDDQRLGRVYKRLDAANGVLNEAHADFRNLDDEGQAKAKRMRDTWIREANAQERADRSYQDWIDTKNVNDFLGDKDTVGWVDMTEDQIRSKYPDLGKGGMAKIKKYQAAERIAREKGGAVNRAAVISLVGKVSGKMSKINQGKLQQEMLDWWSDQVAENQKPPSMSELREELGSRVVQREGRVYGSNPSIDYPKEKREEYKTLPEAKQPTEIGKEYVRRQAEKAVESSLKDKDGKPFKINKVSGKYVVYRNGQRGEVSTPAAGDKAE